MRERVGRELDRDAGGVEHLDEQQPDRPAAEDGRGRPRSAAAEIDGVERDAEGLEQRGGLVRDRVREGVDEVLRPRDERPQPAVGRAVTGEPHLGAEVAVPGEAERAAAAGNRRVEHDGLAATGTARHHAGELVAEDERLAEDRVADASLEEPVPVRAAETDAADPHEHLARLRLRVGLLVQLELTCCVQPQRLHAG